MIADRSRSVGSRVASAAGGVRVLAIGRSRGVVRRALAHRAGQAARVENQADAAVAQNGAAGDAAQPCERAPSDLITTSCLPIS